MKLLQIAAQSPTVAPHTPAPEFHLVRGKYPVLLAVRGSKLYRIEDLDEEGQIAEKFASLSGLVPAVKTMVEPAALSLNIAQSCNLACSYCYADEGRFGGEATLMSIETARLAIQRHICQAGKGPVSVGFIGGEPLLNRRVLHDATRYAYREAASRGIPLGFGITTNGTLLRSEDIELLQSYPFAVNVSLDGGREVHDALRPGRNGSRSFDQALRGIAPLLRRPGKARVAARVTLTRRNLDVDAHIQALTNAGFPEVGVSPMRTGPDPGLRIAGADWFELLERMKSAAQADWSRCRKGARSLRFSNFSTALRQLYRGACNSLPCGSAVSYVSLSAGGRYYSCHRTIGQEALNMGDLSTGPSRENRQAFVMSRAVDNQEPCRQCWARYLCGGGCHAEVIQAGRQGCDSIRGWLEFCIALYPEVLEERPDLLATRREGARSR